MSTAKRLHYSYADYLSSLAVSELKLEYCDGVIYAMAGGTPTHAELGAAVIRVLAPQLLGTCRVYSSDMKVRVDATGLSTFPDVAVVCGEVTTATVDANALTNPTLLVEVTSKSTEDYDRGDKLSHYKQMPSLQVVLFVSHRARTITCVSRKGAEWEEAEFRAGEVIVLERPKLSFPVDGIYGGIILDQA